MVVPDGPPMAESVTPPFPLLIAEVLWNGARSADLFTVAVVAGLAGLLALRGSAALLS